MSEFIADFHLHSRYSRACSKDLTVPELAKWAKIKGIGVLGTGDFTHPLWLQELKDALREAGDGLFEYEGVRFLLTSEVNTLFYKAARRTRSTTCCLPRASRRWSGSTGSSNPSGG